ncbi:MAG TPA: methionyl-tRNA formyltransferase [Pseudomonadota bacterium]|jgi:methionyl-tRNA formyltransferase|nr:methionyl-tRNA formyltransferase [Pseudomonadota bacterium]
MRTVFMGSPEFAVPSLVAVAEHSEVVAVVCQPDKPAGRGQHLLLPAVKVAALERSLPVLQPLFLKPQKSNFVAELTALAPDLVVVVAYGRILPPEVLAIPRLGCWNVHGSVLPNYRGAAPIQWALIRGETKTGVTLMQMEAGLDTGPALRCREIPISEDDTAGTLHAKLAALGADLLAEALPLFREGKIPEVVPQDHTQATLAPMLDKEHGRVDFNRPAHLVCGQLRGVDPWPGGFTFLPPRVAGEEKVLLKLFSPRVSQGQGRPGTVLGVDRLGLHVACQSGAVVIGEGQLPGRKRMPIQALCAGHPIPHGTLLDEGRPNPLLG